MVNEEFIDVRNQMSVLESLLSKLKEKSNYPLAFDKTKYSITNSQNMFCGKYDRYSDKILIDKWFLYDSICSGKFNEIENLLIHEEAHRQNHLQGTYEKGKPDHWTGWINLYLNMGGLLPEVYLKVKAYEYEKEYSSVEEEDIKNIIILGYKEGEKAKYILEKAKKLANFIYVDENRKIKVYGKGSI
jgi:hypothetical protein